MVQDRAIVTLTDQYKVVHDLLNGTIFNDLERPKTQISRSGHSLTLNISEMAKDTAIVTMEGEYETVSKLVSRTMTFGYPKLDFKITVLP